MQNYMLKYRNYLKKRNEAILKDKLIEIGLTMESRSEKMRHNPFLSEYKKDEYIASVKTVKDKLVHYFFERTDINVAIHEKVKQLEEFEIKKISDGIVIGKIITKIGYEYRKKSSVWLMPLNVGGTYITMAEFLLSALLFSVAIGAISIIR